MWCLFFLSAYRKGTISQNLLLLFDLCRRRCEPQLYWFKRGSLLRYIVCLAHPLSVQVVPTIFSKMSSNLLKSHAVFNTLVPVMCILATVSNANLSSKNFSHICILFPVWNTPLRKSPSEFTTRLKELYLMTYHTRALDATVGCA